MDEFEKLALRRRKLGFQELVDVNSELLEDLHTRGLLNEDALAQLKAEKIVNQRATKLVDWLMEAKLERAFLEICSVLVNKYPALSKELQTEVRIERGDVIIDDDVMKEAGTLVHRKFGTSRRFAEVDKKDMRDLIAIKIQLSKEEWKQEMDQVREELNRSMQLCKTKDNAAKELDNTIMKFIKRYEEELVSRAHDMTTTTELIMSSVEDSDYHGKLKVKLLFLLQRTERVVEERELILRDRDKAQHLLTNINERVESNNASVAKAESDKSKKENERKESLIKRLQKMNDALENESERFEKAVEELTEVNKKQAEKIVELEAKTSVSMAPKEEAAHVPIVEKQRTVSTTSKLSGLSLRNTSSRQALSNSYRK